MNERTLGERINTWVQIIAIISGGIWAAYTFVYKEIVQPRLLPSHVSIDAELSKAGKKNSMIAIRGKFTITNNSKRRAILLPSCFSVWGVTNVQDKKKKSDLEILFEKSENYIVTSQDLIITRDGLTTKKKFIVTGPIFKEWYFDPHETASRSLIFYIPDNIYDSIEMIGFFAIVNDFDGISDFAKWDVYKEGTGVIKLFRESKNKKETGDPIDPRNDNDSKFLEERDFGYIITNAVLSLWE